MSLRGTHQNNNNSVRHTSIAHAESAPRRLLDTNWDGADDDDDFVPLTATKATNDVKEAKKTAEESVVENGSLENNEEIKEAQESVSNSASSYAASSMLDISSFTEATTLCQDDPTFLYNDQNCQDYLAEVLAGDDNEATAELQGKLVQQLNKKCQEEVVVDDENNVMRVIGTVCKRSCGLCQDDENGGLKVGENGDKSDDNADEMKKEVEVLQEEIELLEETLEELTSTKDGDNEEDDVEELEEEEELSTESNGGEEEGSNEVVGGEDEKEGVENSEESVEKNDGEIMENAEKEEALVLKEADEDDAYIPEKEEEEEEEVIGEEEQDSKGAEDKVENESGDDEDLASTREGNDSDTDAAEAEEEDSTAEEEVVSVKDEQQTEEETESDLESAVDDDAVGSDKTKNVEEDSEENTVNEEEGGESDGTDAAIENEKEIVAEESNEETEIAPATKEDDAVICKDDPNFEYKGYEGFNCDYIRENKPDKCDKKHEGVKVGIVSCPVSCGMVDECMALQQQESEDSTEEQKDDLQLEQEMESKLEAALEQGTVDEDTAMKLDEEILEAIEEGVGGEFEKELEEELALAEEDSKEVMSNTTAVGESADHLTTIGLSLDEDASIIEVDDPPVVANLTITGDDLSFCQDDPDFKFKGYDGFNCDYIKENKPEKCDKVFDGEKVGVVFCPVSCGMVDECMALQESKVDTALENAEDKETVNDTAVEEETVVTGTTAEESVDEGSEVEQEAAVDIDDEETEDAVEGSKDDTQGGDVDNKAENAASEEETVETETNTEAEDEETEEQNTASSDEKVVEADETSGVCQDDPDFKFKGYDGFNCEYIKENKPEKCNKVFDGEKVGVVSCPVSCGMVEECMALQKQNDTADEAQLSEENEVLDATVEDNDSEEPKDSTVEESDAINEDEESVTKESDEEVVDNEDAGLDEKTGLIGEDETEGEVSDETLTATEVCRDDPDFKFKGYEGFNCEYIKNNKPEKCNKLHSGEKVGVVSCPVSCGMVDECMALQQSKETLAVKAGTEETDEAVGDETDAKDVDEAEVEATTIPSPIQQDEDESNEETGLSDQELEEEIEAKLEKAVEEGELDEEEAEELEYEMEEALEEGIGEVFEAELDKELRCKDDPEFLYLDGDLERDCLWIRQNERCEHVHEDTGKVIGKFFCPETCGMQEECEKVTVADNALISPGVEDMTEEGDDAFEAAPQGTKSMADEIGIESELDEGNVYESEKGDTETNLYVNEQEGGDLASFGDGEFADEEGNYNNEGDGFYNEFNDAENLNQWDNMNGQPASQEYNEYNQEPNYSVGYSQPTNGDNWQGYENNPSPIDYDENWLEDESDFPFGFLILLFLAVGFFIFRKSQNSSRLQENSRGGYQRVGRQTVVQDHSKRY